MSRVSIIIPTYNRETLLVLALDSVFSQTFQNFEIIIVDDGGNDNTEQLIGKYGSKVHYTRLKHTGLPSVVRNAGLKMAQGEFIAFLDSDDLWLPQKLERQIGILDASPDVGLICSNAFVLSGTKRSSNLYLQNYKRPMKGNLLAELLNDNFIITSSCAVRRSLLDLIGEFSEEELLKGVEDYDLWLRAALKTEICYIPEPLVVYRDQGDSIRSQQTRVSYWQSMILILDRLKELMQKSDQNDLTSMSLLEERKYAYCIDLCRSLFDTDRYTDAIKFSSQLIVENPSYLPMTVKKVMRLIKKKARGNLR
jgi:glycosyltransferase involved in cell wall biosynthesis